MKLQHLLPKALIRGDDILGHKRVIDKLTSNYMNKRIKCFLRLGNKIKHSTIVALNLNESTALEIENYVNACDNRIVSLKEFRKLLRSLNVEWTEIEENGNGFIDKIKG